MKRSMTWLGMAAFLVLAAPHLLADVKTQEKTVLKIEGFMGGLISRAAGGDKGITSTIAVKGDRMARMTDTTGDIVDLAAEKVFRVDIKKKEYTVKTFAEMRAELEKAKADAEKQAQQMNPEQKQQLEQAARELEFDVDVKNTGQTKPQAGFNTRETVVTIAMREKGKTLEESGGMVMTSTMWLAPKIAAADEVVDFNVRYFKAVYGGLFTGSDMQQMATLSAILPGLKGLSEKMAIESRKLQGTAISTTTVMESVKSAEQMAALQQQPPASGGGLGGMLARRVAGNRQAQQRSTMMTTTHDVLSIASSASAEDVAVPAGFKEKK